MLPSLRPWLGRSSRPAGAARPRRRRSFLETLESRALLTLSVQGILRYTSSSLLPNPITDPATLTSSDGVPTFSSTTLVGSTFVSPSWTNPTWFMKVGGTGLEIQFQNTGNEPEPVILDWGDHTPSVDPFNPNTAAFSVAPGVSNLSLRHMYLETSHTPYTVTIRQQLAGVDFLIARLNLTVVQAMESGNRFFLRGTTGDDVIRLSAGASNTTAIAANLSGQSGQSWSTSARQIYVEALGGNDQVLANPSVKRRLGIDGGPGDDRIVGGSNNDTLVGNAGNDSIEGGQGDDLIVGGGGDDLIAGNDGNDRLYGGSGNDLVRGGDGNDWIYGDDGVDTLVGNTGNDVLIGGTGRDTLLGGQDNDVLIGGYSTLQISTSNVQDVANAWAKGNNQLAVRIASEPVMSDAFDLSSVPNAVLPDGSTQVEAINHGPSLSGDRVVDYLEGGSGRNLALRDRAIDLIDASGGVTVLGALQPSAQAGSTLMSFPNFVTSAGLDLTGDLTRSAYVLNRTNWDGAALYPILSPQNGVSASGFVAQYGTNRPGLLQILDLNPFPGGDFWGNFNRPYLAYGLAFGGAFQTSSDPTDPRNLFDATPGPANFFVMERNYLLGRGSELRPVGYQALTYDPIWKLYHLKS
ncbi:MAG: calcium-binding protein [Isosphaeraceae bacterium]